MCATIATVCVALFSAPEVEAGQRCWPLKEVLNAHESQGDKILLIFSSWMRDGAYTIILQDPSDGVVTEVAVDSAGTACVFDVGDRLRKSPTFGELRLSLN
jgi:hypothetical protein